jgi:hypothetical protein
VVTLTTTPRRTGTARARRTRTTRPIRPIRRTTRPIRPIRRTTRTIRRTRRIRPVPTRSPTRLDATQKWIYPRFADVNDAIAAGYTSINDAGTGHEHFVNNTYLNSPTVLDPQTIESLV